MKRGLKKIEKIDIVLLIIFLITVLIIIDFIDINERFSFPINVIDEPLLILLGIILGYLIAKFRFLKMINKN